MLLRDHATARRLAPLGAALLGVLLRGCVADERDAQNVEALTVCHTTVVEGIDVSVYQGAIDWAQVHASGREFAIARIGDGTSMDGTFARNWAGIRAAGMVRGAYLFWEPGVSQQAQADLIIGAVGRLGAGDLPVTIDVEAMGGQTAATAASRLRTIIDLVAAGTGKTPMIYTGAWFWDGGTYLRGAASFPGNPLWVSGYTTGCVTVPSGWTDWHFWQYSDGTCAGCPVRNTAVPGVASSPSVDRNRWNGTLAELRAFAGGGGAAWGGQFVMQSFPYAAVGPIQIHAGETQTLWIEMRNIGTSAWDSRTHLGTTGPRDRSDPFAGPEWAGPNRPASIPAGTTVAPGATHRFQWTIHAPATTGRFDEHFGMVQEGVAWFSDPGQAGPPDDQLEAIIEVLPAVNPPDAGVRPDAGISTDGGAGTDAGAGADAGGDAARPASDGGIIPRGDGAADGGPGATGGGCGCTTPGGRAGALRELSVLGVIAAAGAARARRRRRARVILRG